MFKYTRAHHVQHMQPGMHVLKRTYGSQVSLIAICLYMQYGSDVECRVLMSCQYALAVISEPGAHPTVGISDSQHMRLIDQRKRALLRCRYIEDFLWCVCVCVDKMRIFSKCAIYIGQILEKMRGASVTSLFPLFPKRASAKK